MAKILYYIHDPMCSWCWAYKPTWDKIQSEFEGKLNIVKLLGGLAEDSEILMPEDMQVFLQRTWRNIELKVPGTKFNFDFWTKCQPRRSTYPACRAVIAAKKQDPKSEDPMITGIQKAYYLYAKNPSDYEALTNVAKEVGVDTRQFAADIVSKEVQEELIEEILLVRQMEANGFPSVVFFDGVRHHHLRVDYNSAGNIINQINELD